MVKERYETKERVVTERVLVEKTLICDICGKVIAPSAHHWRVTTHHSDWGNDSVESFECFDVCSTKCLKKKFDEYASESNRKYNTMEIEVEHIN